MAAILRGGVSLLAAMVVASGAAARADLWASGAGGATSRVDVFPVNQTTGAYGAGVAISGGAGVVTEDLSGDPFWQGGTLWGVRRAFTTSYLAAWNPVAKTFLFETPINVPSFLRTLAIDPTNGRFYATTDASLYTLDPQTGSAALVGPTTGVTVNKALSFDGNGQLYGVGMENKLVAIDKTSGARSPVGTMALYRIEGMAWLQETSTMLGLGYGYGADGYSLFEINLTNGALVRLGPSVGRPSGLAFTGLAADFDGDGTVTRTDFEIWQTHAGTESGATSEHGDANGDGAVNGSDFLAWQRQYGSTVVPPVAAVVPEPVAVVSSLAAVMAIVLTGRRRARR
jgi:hypothetical protein